jgi:hypothetical protein
MMNGMQNGLQMGWGIGWSWIIGFAILVVIIWLIIKWIKQRTDSKSTK